VFSSSVISQAAEQAQIAVLASERRRTMQIALGANNNPMVVVMLYCLIDNRPISGSGSAQSESCFDNVHCLSSRAGQ
jgi:hypothetical protein